jgi:Family of unknown function (DUF6069)
MTMPPSDASRNASKVNAGRLWAGGLATAVTAALVAIVGILIARGIFDVPVLAPDRENAWGDADTGLYAIGAALAALVATALMHLLILFVPNYSRFFAWIMVLATAAGVVVPFTVNAKESAQIATSLINLALGVTIGSLILGVARTAAQTTGEPGARAYPTERYPPDYPQGPYSQH